MKLWDGKIRLFSPDRREMYIGLYERLVEFAELKDYELLTDKSITKKPNIPQSDIEAFIKTLNVPFNIRDYQLEAVTHAINTERSVLLSPTASGKSFIIYCLLRYYNKKAIVIVPTTSLVYQMQSDFADYSKNDPSFDIAKDTHTIMSGRNKSSNAQIYISTWQSLYKMPENYFNQFDVVIGDECHLWKAKCLTGIMTKMTKTKYRFGTTGTLDGTQVHQLILEGLFGKVHRVTTTKELMDKGHLAQLNINCIVLKYPEEFCKAAKKFKYQDEIDFIVSNEQRNKYIRNLAISTKSNTMILFQYVERHGKILYKMIQEKLDKLGDTKRKVFFVSGETDAEIRERVRSITEKENNAIIVASVGTFSTGINIKRLENIIFASPSKSVIRTLQSIGRGLRIGENKQSATLYDIVDDLGHKSHQNFALKHFIERAQIYNSEKFAYKIFKVELKGSTNGDKFLIDNTKT